MFQQLQQNNRQQEDTATMEGPEVTKLGPTPSPHESPGSLSTDDEADDRRRQHEEEMATFKAQLAAKREKRKEALDGLSRKICELKEELLSERMARQKLEAELRKVRSESHGREEASDQTRNIPEAAGNETTDEDVQEVVEDEIDPDTEADRRAEIEGLERQVKALKDVAAIGGEMLRIRELQVSSMFRY